MEAITATTLLNAGAEMLVMRHPEAIRKVREYVAELGGFALPTAARAKTIPFRRAAGVAPQVSPGGIASQVAASLREGARCKIIQRMDTPAELAPGYAMALIKILDSDEAAGEELTLMAQTSAAQAVNAQEVAKAKKGSVHTAPKPPFQPAKTWSPLEDLTGGYNYKL